MRYVLLASLSGALASGPTVVSTDTPEVTSSKPDRPLAVDMHASRDSLDWWGVYEGWLACAACECIHTLLTLQLQRDGSFTMVTWRLVRDAVPYSESGRFEWAPEGDAIVLNTEAGEHRFAVGEGCLMLLEAGQPQPPPWGRSDGVLARSAPVGAIPPVSKKRPRPAIAGSCGIEP